MSSRADVLERAGAGPLPEGPVPAGGGTARRGPLAALLFLVLQGLFTAVLRLWQPRFFYLDDKVFQYLPVWHWLGQRTTASGFPLVDPDQGAGGAFTADLQYGALDPFHWALAAVLGHMDGMVAAGWALQVLAVVVLGTGVTALATSVGVRPGWAALAAVGAANSGFLMWLAGSWWPAAWGTALLPWLWWALVTRSRWAVPVAVLSAYLLCTSGYPYTLPFALLVVVGVCLERGLRGRTWRLWRDRALVARVAGGVAGVLLAATGLLAAAAMAPYSTRALLPPDPVGNAANFIPNVVDVLVGGPTTSAEVSAWWGALAPIPVMTVGWFVLPGLAFVRWRRVREIGVSRVPGLLTSVVLVVGALVATQTPTEVASLRFPLRYITVLQVVAPIALVALVAAVGTRVSTRRAVVAAGLCVAQAVLAVFRAPALTGWHVAAAVGGLVVLAVVWATRDRLPGHASVGRLGVVALLLATLVAPLVGVGYSAAFGDTVAEALKVPPTGRPDRGIWDAASWPASVPQFRAAALEPDLNATVVVWGASDDRGLSSRMPGGSAPLYSGMRTGYGYSSVGQAQWNARWACQDFLGQTAGHWDGEVGVDCSDPAAHLLALVPGTDRTWLDVMSKDVLLLGERTPASISDSLAGRWVHVGAEGSFQRWERVTPTPGRVTWTGSGVDSVVAGTVETDTETYRVRWSAAGDHRVITRIPWWPGYRASLDGKALPVQAVDGTVVGVDLPDGAGAGELRIWFQPPHLRAGLAAAGLGAVLAVVAVAIDLRRRREDG